jgi:DNA-binding transcriptional ArsR family regulator
MTMTAEGMPLPQNSMDGINRLIHEPARLKIMATLYVLEDADFTFLLKQTGLTRGNLSSHLSKLEEAGYVDVTKTYAGKRPLTILKLSKPGRKAFDEYRETLSNLAENLPR